VGQHKVKMQNKIFLTPEEFNECESFAIKSAKTQREYRSGGTLNRPIWLIESDTKRGKVAEVVAKNFLEQFNIKGIKLDFEIYPRGEWDETDFVINNKKISIKSAKWFSKWLLLESKDINRGDIYDYYIFVTIDKDFKSGTVKGFTRKEDLENQQKTTLLKKGDHIPNTSTILDADNHCIQQDNLNSNWEVLIKEL
jgi:hypothetical protein